MGHNIEMEKRRFLAKLVASQLAVAGGLLALTSADAIEIISNMPGNDGTSTFINAPLGGANGGGVFNSKAAGFTTPAGSPYDLDSVTLRLNFFDTLSGQLGQDSGACTFDWAHQTTSKMSRRVG